MAERGVPINQLSLKDLSGIQQSIEKEVQFLTNSLGDLKTVCHKFKSSHDTVTGLPQGANGPTTLVPLSESLYVHATLTSPDHVLVDIGTGYFAQMTRKEGGEYFKRKLEFLEGQMTQLNGILSEKQNTRQVLTEALRSKVQEEISSQEQQRAAVAN